MCRSVTDNGFLYQSNRLKIKAFYLRLSISNSNNTQNPLPETITLHYLPRLSGTPLEINDSKIRSDSNAFVTLHRVRSADKSHNNKLITFTSRERVRVGEAVRFEIYVKEDKVLKGIFRKDEEEEWKLECECALERGRTSNKSSTTLGGIEISEAEVSVVAEGHVAIIEKVDMRRRKRCRRVLLKGILDEIPEEREDGFVEEFDRCDCCGEIFGSDDKDGEDCLENCENQDEIEMEGVKWAVDVGIWVMCLGVGYLVTKASTKSLRRRVIL